MNFLTMRSCTALVTYMNQMGVLSLPAGKQFLCFHSVDRNVKFFMFTFWGCNRLAWDEIAFSYISDDRVWYSYFVYILYWNSNIRGDRLTSLSAVEYRVDIGCLVNAAIVEDGDGCGEDEDEDDNGGPGDHPGQVAEEEHDDGWDENDGEVAISRLLSCSPLSKFVCLREKTMLMVIVGKPVVELLLVVLVVVFPNSSRQRRLLKLDREKWAVAKMSEGELMKEEERGKGKSRGKKSRWCGGNGFTSREFSSWGRSKWRGGSILGRWDFGKRDNFDKIVVVSVKWKLYIFQNYFQYLRMKSKHLLSFKVFVMLKSNFSCCKLKINAIISENQIIQI